LSFGTSTKVLSAVKRAVRAFVLVPKLQRINDIVPRSGVEYILHTSALLNATPERGNDKF
jgi:hypothetical protein